MAIGPFVFPGLPTRVIFGAGTISAIADEASRLGMKRAMLIASARQASVARDLPDLIATVFSGAAMHTPVSVTETALEIVTRQRIDGMIAIGGGSAIGLAKAIALRTDLKQIAVPTTYAGSEMTDILGETAAGAKTTKRDPRILPETVIYDPDLSRGLPPAIAAASGINAIAHGVEALYAKDRNPLSMLMAEEGIRALARGLPGSDPSQSLYGAYLCGAVLGVSTMALHHKLCHVLGGSFNLPHAETHAVILPHATAYNAGAAPDAMARIAKALGSKTAARGLQELALSLDAPTSLKALGLAEADLDRAADLAMANAYWNPRPLTRDGIRQLLDDAFHGTPIDA